MIDIHSHILPRVDDGASSSEETASLLEGFAALGYARVVATPHWAVGMPVISQALIDDIAGMAARRGIALSVARECRIHPNVLDHIERTPQLRVDGGNVVLMELPWGPVPDYAESVFGWVLRAGYRPVLVHPERHAPLWEGNSPLQRLIYAGVLVQVNIGSLTGEHGNGAQERAISLLEKGAVTLVATDIHRVSEIGTAVPHAHTMLNNLVGHQIASILTTSNPQALMDNQPVINIGSSEHDVVVDRSFLKDGGILTAIWGRSIQNLRMHTRLIG
jgi:protein-tyrosine phosphatase